VDSVLLQYGKDVAGGIGEPRDRRTVDLALDPVGVLGGSRRIALPEVETPEPRPTRQAATHAHLIRALRALSLGEDDELRQHQLRLAFRTARHLERVHEIGAAVEDADLDDIVRVLGFRPDSWAEGDALLER
jgi:hypothetical protein